MKGMFMMKKLFLSLIAVLLCCFMTAVAEETIDLKRLTDLQLLERIHMYQNELAERATQGKEIIYENAELGITVKLKGLKYEKGTYSDTLYLYGTLLNRSDKKVEVCTEGYDVFLNNWVVGCGSGYTLVAPPGRNARGTVFMTIQSLKNKADVSRASDLQTVECVILVKSGQKVIAKIPYVCADFSGLK